MQSYGTVITGRDDSGNQVKEKAAQRTENVTESMELEWNFGCMDFDWLRRYCKTQVPDCHSLCLITRCLLTIRMHSHLNRSG
jgi:hypothetical protein